MSSDTAGNELTFAQLKAREDGFGRSLPDNLGLRVHRAISWGRRAEKEMAVEDYDAAFIFYWIAFNAAYAENSGAQSEETAHESYEKYFGRIILLDRDQAIYSAVWGRFPVLIQDLLNNKFVFQPFWKHHTGVPG